jgi:hypothetical protein
MTPRNHPLDCLKTQFFEHLEKINAPGDVVRDYEVTHLFLLEIVTLLAPTYREFLQHVIEDPYPGYETKKRRVTRILPSHSAAMIFPAERYDDDLSVVW